jgi:uncharacterized protein DUF3149
MAWPMLFGTDIGLLSLFTIGSVVVMGTHIARFVKRHVAEDERAYGRG